MFCRLVHKFFINKQIKNMTKKLDKLIVVAALFCSYNFTVLAQTVEFNTVTEALNYNSNRATVKKIIITGTISGYDYSDESEWSKIRTLYTTFKNLNTVEILTDQDIPDYDETNQCGLFFYNNYYGQSWLINFSAPNIKYIGKYAFAGCRNLTSINFPSVTTIGEGVFWDCNNLTSANFPLATTIGNKAFQQCYNLYVTNFPLATIIGDYAFYACEKLITVDFPSVTTVGNTTFAYCRNLTSINFPSVTNIGRNAFVDCEKLTSATFGTGFETETEIKFGEEVFLYIYETKYIDLILGEYVLPKPDLDVNIWQSNNHSYPSYYKNYIWKSITVKKTNSIEEIIKNSTVSIFPNPTTENATVSFELEKSCNVKIVLCDILGIEQMNIYDSFANEGFFTETIDIGNLPKGVYFIKILIDGNYTVGKIVVN